ncbi:MAG: 2Fe-2S iron-sulfur cluster-binding protein [Albimonas sp.]|uniref:2Fe-2S iron-sulfur cluster-binding protein n=1 Tax=Albimonas sp. TaxID=1872425 RepID=UPI004056CF9B|tara:strand:- start:1140 stop:1712 length:573 start_codon:yes stop_codon:yes gene_type:complete
MTAPTTRLPVRLVVNGAPRELELDPRTTLLDALREHLDLCGSKKGCDHGQCGACTVLLGAQGERRRINACLALAVMHDGEEITTVEGLGTAEAPSDLQQAFVSCDGFQCGYCTPGQIVSAEGMLDEHRRGWPSYASASLRGASPLSDAELAERMSGNLCRCAAYAGIREAIAGVAERRDGAKDGAKEAAE